MDFEVMARPIEGELVSGDSYFVKEFDDNVFVSVIDGLGHGPDAHIASMAAKQCMEQCYDRPLDVIIKMCHEQLAKTRGAVIGIALFDYSLSKYYFLGVGNIKMQLIGKMQSAPFSNSGIVGYNLKNLHIYESSFYPDDIFSMNSDGITQDFILNNYERYMDIHLMAKAIFNENALETDDVTVIVGRL